MTLVRPALLGLVALVLTACSPSPPPPLTGLWDATVTIKGTAIPFQIQLAEDNGVAKANFFDGDQAVNPSSAGTYKDGDLHLEFDSYAATLDAKMEKGVLKGRWLGGRYDYPVEARPHQPSAATAAGPAIDGVWEVGVDSSKGEKAWRLIVQQKAEKAYATILRIDGDTGALGGEYSDGAWRLSRFAGERPGKLEVRPQPDGSLKLVLDDSSGRRELTALRPEAARKLGLAPPTDPKHHTSVKDPAEALRYAAPNLDGKPITQDDFKGKVVLLNVTGSWCPNCHDEAPFLQSLYEKYRAQGLEIVALDFEQGDQVQKPTRLHAFIKKYGLKYTVLLAGETKDAPKVLPQAVNLNAWPTTFFIGRDGRVHSVHVGFTSKGSAMYDAQLKAEMAGEIEQLLAEKG